MSEWVFRGRMHQSPERVTMLLEPGEMYCQKRLVGGPASSDVFFCDPATVSELAREMGHSTGTLHFGEPQTGDPSLYAGFVEVAKSLESGATALERQCAFASALELLLRGHSAERAPTSPGVGWEKPAVARTWAAARRLERGEPPAHVAPALGFADPSHFGRCFRRIMHVSPGVYAASVGRRAFSFGAT